MKSLEYCRHINYSCELSLEIAKSSRVNIHCRAISPVKPDPVKASSRIGNDICNETQVSRHARRC